MLAERTRHSLPLALMAAALALVPILAVMQYRWLGQLSAAERERLQAGLRTAAARFRQDFDAEFARILFSLQGPVENLEHYGERFAEWNAAAGDRSMVRQLYVARPAGGALELLAFSEGSGAFEPAAWPAELGALRPRLEARFRNGIGRGPDRAGFMVDEEIPALVSPLVRAGVARPRAGAIRGGWLPGRAAGPVLLGWSIAAIDLEFVRQELVPELVELHLAGPEGLEYQVRVASRSSPRQIIYDSDTGLGADAFSSADLATGLLAMTWEPMGRPRAPEMEIRRPPRGGGPEMRRRAATPWFGRGEDAGRWELRVKHRLGSLDAAVNRVRHRNLAISFAVLLLMGGAMGMLVVSTRRAQRLARLQMQFVAGVSHELRTPLAVICSAGDNLADGVVAGREQAQRYGAVVRNEGRRLAQMVEQILGFAGIQAGRAKYEMRPVPVAELVERALAACGAGLEESGCRIEQEIQPGLPPVEADATALAHCLRNLISNALQYGREGKWLGIRAKAGAGGKVEIRVEDRGAGIDAADLPHIFEPFYRGKRAIAAQIHGNGLGLSLVQHIVEAHRGSIHVASTPGKGTCFTVTLPAAEAGAGAAG